MLSYSGLFTLEVKVTNRAKELYIHFYSGRTDMNNSEFLGFKARMIRRQFK